MDQQLDDTLRRFDEVLHGAENRRRLDLWERKERGEPTRRIPVYFSVPFDWSIIRLNLWQRLLGRSLDIPAVQEAVGDYPADLARQVILFQLEQRMFYIEHMPGDAPIRPEISTNLNILWLRDCNRANPFWHDIRIDPQTGDFHQEPFIHSREEFERLAMTPFAFDAAARDRRLAVFRDLTGGALRIRDDTEGHGYLNTVASPFSELVRLCGTSDVLANMRLEPELVHDQMRFLTECSIRRCREMNAAVGRDCFMPAIGGDEINCDMFSAADYDAFILPYETRCAAEGHSHYYHSCGNLTPIFDRVVGLPHVAKIHVSPWSKLKPAVAAIGRRAIIQKIVSTQHDIVRSSDADMTRQLESIRADLGDAVGEVACHCETLGDFERSKAFVSLGQRILERG